MSHRISSADPTGTSFNYRGHEIVIDGGVFRCTGHLGPKDELSEVIEHIDGLCDNTNGEMAKHVIVEFEGGLAAAEIMQAIPPMDSDDEWTFVVDMNPGSTKDGPHRRRTYHLDQMYARGDMNAEIWTDMHRIDAQIKALRQVQRAMRETLGKPDQDAIEHAMDMSEEDRTLPESFFYPKDANGEKL